LLSEQLTNYYLKNTQPTNIMIPKQYALFLGLMIIGADKQALSVTTSLASACPAATDQFIVRLADQPVSGIAPRGGGEPRWKSLGALEAKHQRAYCQTLKARQAAITQRLERVGARVVASYQVAFNGLCVEAAPALILRLSKLPGVVSVTRVQPVVRNNSNTVPFVGASSVWSRLSVRGTGVRVAVIDSGIDYTHRDFGGPGTVAAYQANNPRIIEPGSFPTAKVIGGYDFVGDDFPSSAPRPDPDPLDPSANGHGTHIAGIIAGLGVPGQIGPGVAPGALLLAYKIYGKTGGSTQNIVLQALDRAMDPNGDGSVSDHADVINISGGTSRQSPDDPLVQAVENVVRLGAIVVGSAGNDGDNPYFVGGPGVAAGAISVGNSYGGGPIFDAVKVNTPSLGNLIAAEGALTSPLTAAGVTADVQYVGTASAGASLLAVPQGRIALVDRDGRPYTDKVRAVQQAGAIGIIVINSSPSAPTTMTGDRTGITIPGVMISREDGARLKAALASGQRVNVTLSSQLQTTASEWSDRIDDASSRGPRRGDSLIKPDVVAPGVNIVSAAVGSGDRGAPDSGTSCAAPVVAGIAALLRQLHPGWTVGEIKAAIVNTAMPITADGVPYPVSRQGAGRVRADVAAGTQVLAIADDDTPSLSFGVPDDIEQPSTRRVILINKANTPRQFTVGVDYGMPVAARGVAEISLGVPDGGNRIALGPGESAELDVTLMIHADRLSASSTEYDGAITFTDDTGGVLRMPFLVAARTASVASLSGLSGSSLVLQNSNPAAPATAELFSWAIDDPSDLGTEGDIQAVGVRSVVGPSADTTRVQFALTTYRPWTTPFGPQFTLLVDRDRDGQADLSISNDDAGILAGGVRSGVPAGVLRDLVTGKVLAVDLPLEARPNSGIMIFGVTAAQLGLNHSGRVNLWAQGWDPWRSDRQLDRTAVGSFDPYHPDLAGISLDLQFEQGTAVDLGSAATSLPGLLILYPTNRAAGQAQTLSPQDIATVSSRTPGSSRRNGTQLRVTGREAG
jgi:minor extracellular serine protease Vpr